MYIWGDNCLWLAITNDTYPSGNGVDGFNSAILPQKLNGTQWNQKKSYPLGLTARRSLRERTKIELQEVLCFFCLDLGCLHARGKSYLATGIIDVTVIENESCDNLCCICTKKWHDQFIPVYSSYVVAFLECLMQTGKLPVEVDYKDPISSLWAGSAFWKETVFDWAACGISRMQVDALFLSLTASGILQLNPKDTSCSGALHGNMLLPTTMIALLKHTSGFQSTREMMHGKGWIYLARPVLGKEIIDNYK